MLVPMSALAAGAGLHRGLSPSGRCRGHDRGACWLLVTTLALVALLVGIGPASAFTPAWSFRSVTAARSPASTTALAAAGDAGAPAAADFDVVVLGATGFTGKLACEYFAERGPAGLRWAMAGRNLEKLANLRNSLPEASRGVPLLQVDVTDEQRVREIAGKAKVIINFAGTPYYDKALPVVSACADTGCCYIDITGEVPLMKVSADRYDSRARETGALVIHACGYDSIPFDIGAFLAAREMRARHGVGCARIRSYVEDSLGGVSGGTLATGIELLDKGNKVEGAQALSQPYGLDPPGGIKGPDVGDGGEVGVLPQYIEDEGFWAAPSVMSAINAKVVRRSNALQGYSYGERASYGEAIGTPNPFVAFAVVAGLAVGGALVALPLTRRALLGTVLPLPGQGPPRDLLDSGFFKVRTLAYGEQAAAGSSAPRVVAHVESGDGGDPGYKCTARMACEAGLCCALERGRCFKQGGVVTPAVGLGQALVDRLNASGMRLYVDPPLV